MHHVIQCREPDWSAKPDWDSKTVGGVAAQIFASVADTDTLILLSTSRRRPRLALIATASGSITVTNGVAAAIPFSR